MQSLTKTFQDSLNTVMTAYFKSLVSKYDKSGLTVEMLMEHWNSSFEEKMTVPVQTLVPSKQEKEEKTEKKPKGSRGKKNSGDFKQCEYKFTKGEKSGQQCTSRCAEGLNTCKRHEAKNGSKTKSQKKEKSVTTEKVPRVLSMMENKKSSVNITKNKFGNLELSGSGLVFNLQNDKQVAVGRQLDSGEVLKLSETDVELCKSLRVQYDESCVKSEKSEKVEDKKKEKEEEEEEADEEVEIEDDD